ncbi:LysR family transcriptional regulator substrate-binding protein [Streptomyces sp. K1PN6]|uniref:LysR family transcriptional regulator substrate-binding protein n=2 Tax=Streptomyces acidicola TaxID=2596892 RepID=A0A5N8WVP9_9ACTN|nr:LysR family transcriptional regulator substrate-binding protein [Streptomyces acidicola]
MIAANSTEIARQVRGGDLEAGIVALPVDGRGIHLSQTVWKCGVAYFSTDPGMTRRRMDIAQLGDAPLVLPEAAAGNADPTRRQLNERAQLKGGTIAPEVKVESPTAALEIAAFGVAASVAPCPLARILGYTERMTYATFAEPAIETFAFATREPVYVSSATRVILALAAAQLHAPYTEHGHGVDGPGTTSSDRPLPPSRPGHLPDRSGRAGRGRRPRPSPRRPATGTARARRTPGRGTGMPGAAGRSRGSTPDRGRPPPERGPNRGTRLSIAGTAVEGRFADRSRTGTRADAPAAAGLRRPRAATGTSHRPDRSLPRVDRLPVPCGRRCSA